MPETVTETDPVSVTECDGEFVFDKLDDALWVPLEVTDCEPDVVTLTDADTESDGDEEDEPETVGLVELDTVEELDTLSEAMPEGECEFVPLLELLTVTEVLFDARAVCDVEEEPDIESVTD